MKMPNGTMMFSSCPQFDTGIAFAPTGGRNARLRPAAAALNRVEDPLNRVT
jgi:hypothetical protein